MYQSYGQNTQLAFLHNSLQIFSPSTMYPLFFQNNHSTICNNHLSNNFSFFFFLLLLQLISIPFKLIHSIQVIRFVTSLTRTMCERCILVQTHPISRIRAHHHDHACMLTQWPPVSHCRRWPRHHLLITEQWRDNLNSSCSMLNVINATTTANINNKDLLFTNRTQVCMQIKPT